MGCILVVEDNVEIRNFLVLALESCNHIVYPQSNGKYATDFMEANDGGNFIDLITTDREMPIMGGIAFSLRMKNDYPNIPILMIATVKPDSLVVDDFLAKPFIIENLIAKVGVLLKK